MESLLETIRAATANDASAEQKAAGVQACRTIIAALDTEPGKPLAPPSLLATSLATPPTLDQMLDLAIARLSTIASAHDAATATQKVSAVPRQLPTGLRVPVLRPVARTANASPIRHAPRDESNTARPVPTKRATAPTRKP